MPRTISLSGLGEVRMAPDMAVVTVGVLSQAAMADEALAANTQAMNSVFEALKAGGIENRDIQTSNFMVQPRYDYNQNGQAPKLVGYDVSNSVSISVRKLDRLGSLLDTLVKAGSNQINGINFQVAEPDAALDEARRRAVADAMRKAETYATAAKIKLGPILSLSEGVNYQPPIPMEMKAIRSDGMAPPVPIAQGEQTLSVNTSITWEIQ
jgi:uncharacterized protein YggE